MLTGNKDIDLLILSHLDDKSLSNFYISNPKNNYLKKLSENQDFWRNRLMNNFPEFKDNDKNWKQNYLALVYYSDKYTPNKAMEKLAEKGMKYINLIDFFIEKGANNWNLGMCGAAEGGHKELIDFFIEKGARDWNDGMREAEKGHKELVDFFIKKGADKWNLGMYNAAFGGHKELVDFFIEKGADKWNLGCVMQLLEDIRN
jgi:hypothetical protein